jgi:ATP-dependent helicase HrpB
VLSGHDYFVVLDARERQGAYQARATTQIESLLPIPGDLLLDNETGLLVDSDGPAWNEARKKIRMVSRLAYGELTLSESDRDFEPEGRDAGHSPEAGALLARAVIGWDPSRVRAASSHDLLVALPVGAERREELETLLARLSLVRETDPQFSAIPDFRREGTLGPLVLAVLSRHPTARALEAASDSDWLDVLGVIPSHELDAWTPTQIQLGPARKSRIKYNLIQPPWVESRLQDFFGVKKNPSVLKGRLPLILHLLAPNQRALQVTQDLEGFWKRVYPELRNQLSRRYPRHAWPEDPQKIPPREG